jgi:hypothetical protein
MELILNIIALVTATILIYHMIRTNISDNKHRKDSDDRWD